MLDAAVDGATLLLNSPYDAKKFGTICRARFRRQIIDKRIKVYAIDAYAVAKEKQLGNRINTIMQTCFFAISGVLPRDEAIEKIKESIRKTYGKRGEPVVRQNFAAVDAALAHLHEVAVPAEATSTLDSLPAVVRERARICAASDCRNHRRPRRPVAGQRISGRRHLSSRHRAMGEAQHRAGSSGLGTGSLYRVWQVRSCLPTRDDSREGL